MHLLMGTGLSGVIKVFQNWILGMTAHSVNILETTELNALKR